MGAECFNVADPIYLPARRSVSAVTQATEPTVTTDIDHKFLTGDVVRFYIPREFGMRQLHHKVANVTKVSDTTFTIDIDTRDFDAFSAPASPKQCAYAIPFGDRDVELAFQNVKPSGVRNG